MIVLSAKSEDTDKILGLSMGADDYVTKPFNPQELAARVRSQLRRYTPAGGRPRGGAAGPHPQRALSNDPDRREPAGGRRTGELTATGDKDRGPADA